MISWLLERDRGGKMAASGVTGTPLHAAGREILHVLPGGPLRFCLGDLAIHAHVTGTSLLLARSENDRGRRCIGCCADTTAPAPGGRGDSINAVPQSLRSGSWLVHERGIADGRRRCIKKCRCRHAQARGITHCRYVSAGPIPRYTEMSCNAAMTA